MPHREARFTATAVAVGIAMSVALLIELRPSSPSSPCDDMSGGSQPIAPPLALGNVFEAFRGSNHWYNVSVASAGVEVRDEQLVVEDPDGAVVEPGPLWSLSLVTPPPTEIFEFAWRNAGPLNSTWLSNSSQAIEAESTFSLLAAPTNLSGQGLNWVFEATTGAAGGCTSAFVTTIVIP